MLADLDLSETPLVEVFTKVDLVEEPGILDRAARLHPEACFVSAKTGAGVDDLTERIGKELTRGFVEECLVLPLADTLALVRLRREVEILGTKYHDATVEVRYRVAPECATRIRREALEGGAR